MIKINFENTVRLHKELRDQYKGNLKIEKIMIESHYLFLEVDFSTTDPTLSMKRWLDDTLEPEKLNKVEICSYYYRG